MTQLVLERIGDVERQTIELTHESERAWHGYLAGWSRMERAAHGYCAWFKDEWELVGTNTAKISLP